jgi:hypothetical protein
LSTLEVPDATIGDSGFTLHQCYNCIEKACPKELVVCNADCPCAEAVLSFVACVASGMPPLSCGVPLLGQSDPNATALAMCVGGSLAGGSGTGCLDPCGANLGVDAGVRD